MTPPPGMRRIENQSVSYSPLKYRSRGGRVARSEQSSEDIAGKWSGTLRRFRRFETKGKFLLIGVWREVERSFGGHMFLRVGFTLRKKFQVKFSCPPRFLRGQTTLYLYIFLQGRQGLIQQSVQEFLWGSLGRRITRNAACSYTQQGMIVYRIRRRGGKEQQNEENADHGVSLSTGRHAVKRGSEESQAEERSFGELTTSEQLFIPAPLGDRAAVVGQFHLVLGKNSQEERGGFTLGRNELEAILIRFDPA